ncbi:capsule assembly Wzi family protein [Marinobacter sp. CHS3-4]|uniref:capsule assembly Wzi family protein n=1 Tax=Marinobacter sp. CHS3-4 TaxID=3045174 RepID=UPI0024B5E500|nr:capsule assembly Wzi family protein [Marinobacter sp. CHS3-4]MDI9244986.1 capsule assembly Wzi family protein [Marinobacter sp. CHS3-4]
MTSKHLALVGGAVACLAAVFGASIAQASPWLEPGDNQARFALQKLADRGHLDRTVSTWPVMMGSVKGALNGNSIASDAPAVGSARAYLNFEMDRQGSPGWRAEYELAAVSEPTFVRDFQAAPRENGVTSLNLQWQGEALALGLKPTFAANPEDDQSYRLDGSYIAGTAGNWVVGAGAIDRWWGPGWQSSLILSNNARPLPAVWINRKDATAPESDWLEWVGPWDFTVFAGQLIDDRVIPRAKLIGMRLTLRPIEGLDIGFSRAIMLGGQGRSEGVSTLWKAFIGDDNDTESEQPGNQLGSIDIRYGFGLGEQSLGFYTQIMGEDEAGYAPAKKSWLLGVDATSQLMDSDQQWFFEFSNTLADDILGDVSTNVAYEHSQYRTGYRYNGRNMASTFEGDAESFTVGVFNFFPEGQNLSAAVSYMDLNIDGTNNTVITADDVFYNIPSDNQQVALLSLGYGTQFLNGWLDLTAQATDKKIKFLSGEKDQWSVGAAWRYRF